MDKDIKAIVKSEYCEEFDALRRTRMLQSYYKYGPAKLNYGEGRCDAVASAMNCIDTFHSTHNLEYLLDAANYLMLRYMYPMPDDFFRATSSEESAGIVGKPVNFEK